MHQSKPSKRQTPSPDPHDMQLEAGFLRHACDAIPNMIFVKDMDLRIIYANAAFMKLFAPDERPHIIGRSYGTQTPAEEIEIFMAEDRKAFAQGQSELIEELTDYQGVRRVYMTRKTRFTGTDGKDYLFCICTDITELRQREAELVQSRALLENFAAIAAHDLRSPLSSVVSCLDLVQLDPDTRLSDKTANYVSMIQHSLRGLIDQVGGLLKVYRAGKLGHTEIQHCDMKLLMEEVLFNLQSQLSETGAVVRTNVLPTLNVDRNLFRQLFHNIIENSLKNRSANRPIIIIRHEMNNHNHVFSITDNGLGMNNARRRKAVAGGGHVDIESYGIGLTLCKQIIQHHHGEIWIDEDYTDGYRICFSIPNMCAAGNA